ncbi:hypothetical protein AA80_06025 [Petrotoga sibirica DSM 13575]|uniref:Uncharacterized protein n=1 Tax=Petrotoga sibirica DSM 13575 TaxID=1122956 RepID=A0A855MLN5_9BACT|nr:hypothetical protein AA80_06025 [Petrotoga sibirica DSM 13575]POZ90377.1 hypothetical protein AD60_07765 [Petrotoga sp. SL27]
MQPFAKNLLLICAKRFLLIYAKSIVCSAFKVISKPSFALQMMCCFRNNFHILICEANAFGDLKGFTP